MSIIVLKHHDENIYDVTPKEEIHIKRSPRYVSKFRESVKEEHKRNNSIRGKECGIMGPPEQQPPHPSRFLKKHTAEQARLKRNAEIKKDSESLKVSKMQPVPRTADLLKEYDKDRIQPSKNFVAENIKQVLESKPREPEQRVVIDRYGERKELSRGLEPRYINSKVFGKTPPYLVNFINIKKRQKQLQKDAEALKQPKCRYITREEREQLLAVSDKADELRNT